MAEESRRGEFENVPFRSGRFYNIDSKWYFSSREQADIGPFNNKEQAAEALSQYLKDIATVDGLILAS